MKFIFPQNYDFKSKLFGIIDYNTIFLNLIWDGIVLLIINILFKSLNIKISLFLIFCFPLFLFSFFGYNGENILYISKYIIKFLIKQKILLFNK